MPGQNVEMEPLTAGLNGPNHSPMRGGDPNAILNELRQIDQGINSIKNNLSRLEGLQRRSLNDPDSSTNSTINKQLDEISSETMTMYRNFAGRIKAIKQQPESGSPRNAPQLGKVDRGLKDAIREYQTMDSDFRKKLQEQMARQYRIVRPDASEAEVRAAVEDTSNQQVFSQALLQSDRRGQSRSALSAVQNRHEAIQKIEQQMIELAELFQDMEALVVQQEAAVVNIEMKGEEVVDNMDKGTQEIGTAIQSARNARKWKWWCLGICGMFSLFSYFAAALTKLQSSSWSSSLLSFSSTSSSSKTTTTAERESVGLSPQPTCPSSTPHESSLANLGHHPKSWSSQDSSGQATIPSTPNPSYQIPNGHLRSLAGGSNSQHDLKVVRCSRKSDSKRGRKQYIALVFFAAF